MGRDEMVAFWLMPAKPESDYLAALIGELARRFDAPVFEPHVTLFGGNIEEQVARSILGHCAPVASIELEIERVAFSGKFTKTVFVQFRPSGAATALSESIRAAAGSESDYEFNAHLSLIYKAMPEREKGELAESIALPFERVTCDAIKAIVSPAGVTHREDVEAWRTIGEWAFGSQQT